jgi:hypothetical protein
MAGSICAIARGPEGGSDQGDDYRHHRLAFLQRGRARICLRFLGEARPTRENGQLDRRATFAILGT